MNAMKRAGIWMLDRIDDILFFARVLLANPEPDNFNAWAENWQKNTPAPDNQPAQGQEGDQQR